MKQNYRTFWKDSVKQWHSSPCPIDDNRLAEMARHAAQTPRADSAVALGSPHGRFRLAPRLRWAVACIALLLVGLRMLAATGQQPAKMHYNGQTVLYLSNISCDTACVFATLTRFVDPPSPLLPSAAAASTAMPAASADSPLEESINPKN